MDESGPIYHLARRSHWEAGQAEGAYRQSTVDWTLAEEGFIHCSFAEQVAATADRYYRDVEDVVLLTIDPAKTDAEVRVEKGFPHIYGPVPGRCSGRRAAIPCRRVSVRSA